MFIKKVIIDSLNGEIVNNNFTANDLENSLTQAVQGAMTEIENYLNPPALSLDFTNTDSIIAVYQDMRKAHSLKTDIVTWNWLKDQVAFSEIDSVLLSQEKLLAIAQHVDMNRTWWDKLLRRPSWSDKLKVAFKEALNAKTITPVVETLPQVINEE